MTTRIRWLSISPLVVLLAMTSIGFGETWPGTSSLGYPQFVKYGQTGSHIITVSNPEPDTLKITAVVPLETSYPGETWLSISAQSLTIPPLGSDSFTVTITATPFFTAGTYYSLNGRVVLYAPANVAESVFVPVNNYLVADTVVGIVWDTVSTMCTRLVVSSNGDIGHLGAGGVNLDYVGSQTDCADPPQYDDVDVYLVSGGPMVIKNNGSNYVFSSALYQADIVRKQAFRNISGGIARGGSNSWYDSFYTSNMVNRDSSIVLNRAYYAPKQADSCNFIVVKTRYTAKTVAQPHVLISEVIDWDVPAHGTSVNRSGVSSKGFVYQRGFDTTSSQCSDSNRWAAVSLLGYYHKSEMASDPCTSHQTPYGAYTQYTDSLHKYDSTDEATEAAFFWNQASSEVKSVPGVADQYSVLTVAKDITVSPTDTLVAYTVLTTVKQGTLYDLEAAVSRARCWYISYFRYCAEGCGVGYAGNVNCDPADGVDIADLTALIDNLFISFTPLCCNGEANCDGDFLGSVDIGDLTALIDHLFITFTPLPDVHGGGC